MALWAVFVRYNPHQEEVIIVESESKNTLHDEVVTGLEEDGPHYEGFSAKEIKRNRAIEYIQGGARNWTEL